MKNVTNTIEKPATNRQLISEDQSRLNTILNQTNRIYPAIKEISIAYEALKLGAFDNTIYQEIVKQGLSGIQNRYAASIEKMLDNLNINLEAVRDNFKNGTDQPLKKLDAAYQNLLNSANPGVHLGIKFPLETITIKNGNPEVNEEFKEQILETYCRVYIQQGPEMEMYKTLETLETSFNDFVKLLKEAKFTNHINIRTLGFLDRFLILQDDQTAKINPIVISDTLTYNERFNKSRVGVINS